MPDNEKSVPDLSVTCHGRAFAKLQDEADPVAAHGSLPEIKNALAGVRRDDVIVRVIAEYDGVSAQNREAA